VPVTNQSHGALQDLTDGALAVDGSDIRSCAAASWNVRLTTSQRPGHTKLSRNFRRALDAGHAAHSPVKNASAVPIATTINTIVSIMTMSLVTRRSHFSIGRYSRRHWAAAGVTRTAALYPVRPG
jgi:hypothetical protein